MTQGTDFWTTLGQSPVLWSLESAVSLAQSIEAKIRPLGYYTALTGGCLHRGFSHKDVDIHIMKLDDNASYSRKTVTDALLELKLECWVPLEKMNSYPGRNRRDVEIWGYKGKRVDIFFNGLDIRRCFTHDECIQSQFMGEKCYEESEKRAWKNPDFNTIDGESEKKKAEENTVKYYVDY